MTQHLTPKIYYTHIVTKLGRKSVFSISLVGAWSVQELHELTVILMPVHLRQRRQVSNLQEIKAKRFGDGKEDNDQDGFEVKTLLGKGNP